MNQINHYLIVAVDKQYLALQVQKVVEVLRAVLITEVPEAPALLLGVLDIGGEIVPILNLRKKLNLPPRAHALNDRIIIYQHQHFKTGFFINDIMGIAPVSQKDIQLQNTINTDNKKMLRGISKYKSHNVLHYRCDFFTGDLMQDDSAVIELEMTGEE